MEWEGEGEDSQGDRDSDDVPGTELHIHRTLRPEGRVVAATLLEHHFWKLWKDYLTDRASRDLLPSQY